MKVITFFLLLFCLTISTTYADGGESKSNKQVNRIRRAQRRTRFFRTVFFNQTPYNSFMRKCK